MCYLSNVTPTFQNFCSLPCLFQYSGILNLFSHNSVSEKHCPLGCSEINILWHPLLSNDREMTDRESTVGSKGVRDRVSPRYRGSEQQQSDPSSCQRGGPISKHVKVWKEEIYGQGSRWSPKPRTTAGEDHEQFSGLRESRRLEQWVSSYEIIASQ
jgi:hypothetical protein